MRFTYVLHIVAGSLGLVSGYVALYTTKGAPVHRRAGTVFVYTMLAMCLAGFSMAVGRGVAPEINVPAAVITASLVVTALTAVRPPFPGSRWIELAATLGCLGVGVTMTRFTAEAIANGGMRGEYPAFPFALFGAAGLLAVAGDVRVLRSGRPTGARRVARHLWRMTFALFIAALSFFIGQAKVIPEPIRIRPLLALPVLAVLVTLLYWMWRVRWRRSLRGLLLVGAPVTRGT
jgi:hypothetical protein